jgi:outer membrane protein OmpA-like peptidoglycan-associated protein
MRPASKPSGLLQRTCKCGQHTGGGSCAKCAAEDSRAHGLAADTAALPDSVRTALREGGRPLDGSVREFMESRFGRDFSGVRVHTGSQSRSSAEAMHAQAYTVGQDIVFGAGAHAPGTAAGRRLIAHELTHTLQQRSAPGAFAAKSMLSEPGGADEREADRAAAAVMGGGARPAVSVAPTAAVQRACGVAGIGTPAGCSAEPPTFVPGQFISRFNVECDEFAPGEEAGLVTFAGTVAASGGVVVHGYASNDGDPAFNQNLSCARAHAAERVLAANGVSAGRITIQRHGPTAGPAADRRSATIEAPIAPTPAPPTPTPAPPAPTVPVAISGNTELWWFDGETPPTYPVNQALTASAGGVAGTFTWSLVTPAPPLIVLPVTVSGTNSIAIVGSLAPSVIANDILVRVDFVSPAGAGTAFQLLTVRTPHSLNHLRDVDLADATFGYHTEIHYSTLDQFRTVLPRNLPLNEQFTGGMTRVFPFSNWRQPAQCGATGVCGAAFNPADWFDFVSGEAAGFGFIPEPSAPGGLLSGIPVDNWPGEWRIGSSIPGRGRLVRSIRWERRIGRARHV